ncbi:hypothetical protein BOTBODRAFT_191096 [Botryobasidium botryosum FD-172 SS1]|uniref:Uncharacterized protein n=1 Tax=Botryobasidium botryosum (strain FD-172 SS1) TaxID=930990 RepID=A0A067M140_BOTB1|nr:hypothetical protein BOTBODRAFT_191096 [Botryobasidium botryosum FD-172 SS1]
MFEEFEKSTSTEADECPHASHNASNLPPSEYDLDKLKLGDESDLFTKMVMHTTRLTIAKACGWEDGWDKKLGAIEPCDRADFVLGAIRDLGPDAPEAGLIAGPDRHENIRLLLASPANPTSSHSSPRSPPPRYFPSSSVDDSSAEKFEMKAPRAVHAAFTDAPDAPSESSNPQPPPRSDSPVKIAAELIGGGLGLGPGGWR